MCSLYLVNSLLSGIEFPCTKSILYTWSYTIQTLYVYAMVDDPCIGQQSGHAYPCTNAEGLFITDAEKRLSPSLPLLSYTYSKFFLILHPARTHARTCTCVHTHTHIHRITTVMTTRIIRSAEVHCICMQNHSSLSTCTNLE